MNLLLISDLKVRIFFLIEKDTCEAWSNINDGFDQYQASCNGILIKLHNISKNGLEFYNSKVIHEASKSDKIDEIIHGDLRLFFFKERNNIICTFLSKKQGQKANTATVKKSVTIRKNLQLALQNEQLNIYTEKGDGSFQLTTKSY